VKKGRGHDKKAEADEGKTAFRGRPWTSFKEIPHHYQTLRLLENASENEMGDAESKLPRNHGGIELVWPPREKKERRWKDNRMEGAALLPGPQRILHP